MSATKVIANGQELTVSAKRFCVLVHDNGIRVDVPEAFEIGPRETLRVMEEMGQRAWDHIRTGELFRVLFATLFPGPPSADWKAVERPDPGRVLGKRTWEFDTSSSVPVPPRIADVNKGDLGVAHACGMIVLGCEALFAGRRKLFFRNPETYLHPAAERLVVTMLEKMMLLAGQAGEVREEPR